MKAPVDRITWPVRTRRLVLRAAVAEDAEAMWRYRRLPDVQQWTTRAPRDLDAFRRQAFEGERLGKTVLVELDGTVVGDLMLGVEDGWAQAEVADDAVEVQAELGWVLDPAHGGRGYATEAAAELLRLCFEVLGLRRVTAACFADNEPSWRLMERIGMRREVHTVKESLHRSGAWLDGYGYALLAEEWWAGSGWRAPGVVGQHGPTGRGEDPT